MVSKQEAKSIQAQWPSLNVYRLPIVIRFGNPSDLDANVKPKQLFDLMLHNNQFQKTILKMHVKVDARTGDRIPTVADAGVSKYSAVISKYRKQAKKQIDAGDLHHLIQANESSIDRISLRGLAKEYGMVRAMIF